MPEIVLLCSVFMKKKIVILASGGGTNAENIIRYFQTKKEVQVVSVLSNNRKAGVFERIQSLGVPALYYNTAAFSQGFLTEYLEMIQPDLIVLAGFLKKIPEELIAIFPNKIINIHPALLPKYGGKGMYGMHVHQAVKEAGEKESGITIHYVNAQYDEGAIIFQATTSVEETDTPEDIAAKIHSLEQEHFPRVIAALLNE